MNISHSYHGGFIMATSLECCSGEVKNFSVLSKYCALDFRETIVFPCH